MSLLLVVAHPDDETFGAGSLLLHAAAEGVRTVVVCATRGEAGEVRPGVAVPPEGLGALREEELRSAATALGVDAVEVHDAGDSGMDGDPPPGSLCATSLEATAEIIRDAIRRHRPTVVAALSGDDGHRDHVRVREALLAATAGGEVPVYLQAFPRSVMHAWLLERTGDAGTSAYHALPEIGTPDEDVTTVIDTSAHFEARLAAIARHRSQRPPFEDLSDDLLRRFLTRDRFIRAVPAWHGGPTETALLGLEADH